MAARRVAAARRTLRSQVSACLVEWERTLAEEARQGNALSILQYARVCIRGYGSVFTMDDALRAERFLRRLAKVSSADSSALLDRLKRRVAKVQRVGVRENDSSDDDIE